MTTILVTGATGTLGRQVAERLRTEGADVRRLSRRSPSYAVDLRDGQGLDAAVEGADVIVHCASTPRGGDDRAAGFLINAAQRAGTPHLVYISIVGVDRLPLGYYTVKHRVERMIEDSGLGATILRTTQFHDLALRILSGAARLPVLPVPAGVSLQPVDSGEVADRLTALALAGPAGRVPDLGGPEVRTLTDLAGAYLRATGRRRRVVPVRLAGQAYAGYRRGDHLAPEHAGGTVTFEEFLDRRHRHPA
ncbi:nucleoside-diphosphate sugar epimerase [Streptomyces sp. JS01]|uniref:SDR family oxidoreductase n=1 Tax=Streptomyces sp. JS01 TaxID=1525753 RepID=UPI0004FFD18B|nr:NAD(P)H-binding protein [Streptomyces sp. JS01]KFK86467.1 nucleoside-diphosphate sugar epimerase [Streptomyces sp. JS01]